MAYVHRRLQIGHTMRTPMQANYAIMCAYTLLVRLLNEMRARDRFSVAYSARARTLPMLLGARTRLFDSRIECTQIRSARTIAAITRVEGARL